MAIVRNPGRVYAGFILKTTHQTIAMKIILKSLQLINFMGIRSKTIEFNEHLQSIYGANETGKSTLFNAFLWLSFGKDMEGRKDYKVKTTSPDGKEIAKLDHEVTGTFDINGQEVTARRILKEKWPTPRGAAEPVFAGNETEFYWNGVPLKEKEYQEKINGIVKENVFKLITNPLYFNSGISWQERRSMLMELGGEIKDEDIASGDPRFMDLLKKLVGKSLPEYKKEIAAKKKKIREAQEAIPSRIDEATRSLPEPQDFDALAAQIKAKEVEISGADESLADAANAQKGRNTAVEAKNNEIHAQRMNIQTIEGQVRSQFNQDKIEREGKLKNLRAEGRNKDNELSTQKAQLNILQRKGDTLAKSRQDLIARWHENDKKQPDPQNDDFKCPSCKQDLPTTSIDAKNAAYKKTVEIFNNNKVLRSQDITSQGKEVKAQIEANSLDIQTTTQNIAALEAEIAALRTQIADLEAESLRLNNEADSEIAEQINAHPDIAISRHKISAIEAEITVLQSDVADNSDLKTHRLMLMADLDGLKKAFNTKEQIERTNKRIAELEKEERDLAQQIADIDGIEFVIQEFTRAKIDTLESRINHKFKYAKFKLFDMQVNGQEVECCETMYKGVVFGAMNNAARVQVGIDIINVLSDHFNVKAPVFLDNRESVTSIPDTDAQIINLIVSPNDKQLRVA